MRYILLTETESQQNTNPGAYGVGGDIDVDPETGELIRNEDDDDEDNDKKARKKYDITMDVQEDFGLDVAVNNSEQEAYLASLITHYLEGLTPDEIMALTNSAPFKQTLDIWANQQ